MYLAIVRHLISARVSSFIFILNIGLTEKKQERAENGELDGMLYNSTDLAVVVCVLLIRCDTVIALANWQRSTSLVYSA